MQHQPTALLPTVEQQRKKILDQINEVSSFRQIIGIAMVQVSEISKLLVPETLRGDKNIIVEKVDFLHLGKVAASLTQDINALIRPTITSLLGNIDNFEAQGKQLVDMVIEKANEINLETVRQQADLYTTEGSLIFNELQEFLFHYNTLAVPAINEVLKTLNDALVENAPKLTFISPIQLNTEG